MALRRGRAVGHEHDLLDARDLSRQRLKEANQRLVDEENLVLRVIDDEFQVLSEKAQVQGVQHRTHARDGVVQLKVPRVVEGKGGHAIARLDPEALEGAGKTVDARHQVGVGHAMDTLLAFGDDLAPAVQALQAPEHVLDA